MKNKALSTIKTTTSTLISRLTPTKKTCVDYCSQSPKNIVKNSFDFESGVEYRTCKRCNTTRKAILTTAGYIEIR